MNYDKDKVAKIKEQYKQEEQKQREECIAKIELFWEQQGATEEDFPRLHEWVNKLGSYEGYYRVFVGNGSEYSELQRIVRNSFREKYPLIDQLNMSYDQRKEMDDKLKKIREEKRKNSWWHKLFG